jgi:hypothetical protein
MHLFTANNSTAAAADGAVPGPDGSQEDDAPHWTMMFMVVLTVVPLGLSCVVGFCLWLLGILMHEKGVCAALADSSFCWCHFWFRPCVAVDGGGGSVGGEAQPSSSNNHNKDKS